jgi:hypothetical protein
MIWSQRGLRKLDQRVAEARKRIEDLFASTSIEVDSIIAWGQFLDAPRQQGQYGIYGTSAAIQVLTTAGYPPNHRLIEKALEGLPLVGPHPEVDKYYDPDDRGILYKDAFVLSASQPGAEYFEEREPVGQVILSRIIDSRGWGDYVFPEKSDDVPRLMPTVAALLPLSRDREFIASDVSQSVLKWVCRRLLDDGDLLPHENAFGVLTLLAYAGLEQRVADYRNALNTCIDRLTRWAKTRDPVLLGQNAEHHYWTPLPGSGRNHYMFYLPEVLVALAFLRAGNPHATRRFVLKVVEDVTKNVRTHGGFRSLSNDRFASVDQLWVYHLLTQFSTCAAGDPRRLLPRVAVVAMSTPIGKMSVVAALLGLGVGATALSLATDSVWTQSLSLALGGLFVGVLSTALWAWWTER